MPRSSASLRVRPARAPARVPILVHTRKRLLVRSGALRIAIVADTHGSPHPNSHAVLRAAEPDHILHAGDVGDLSVLEGLEAIAPLTAIRGNIDVRAPGLPDVVTIAIAEGERTLVTLLLLHIGVYGPRLRADAARLARAEGAAIVVCGHSHVPFLGRDGGLTIVNPGSIGPRRFQLPIVFALMDVTAAAIAVHHVSCETGARWEP